MKMGNTKKFGTNALAMSACVLALLSGQVWGSGAAGDDDAKTGVAAVATTGNVAPLAGEALAAEVQLYREHLMTVANPFFEGRAPGTRGLKLAADYIQFHMEKLQFKPAFAVVQKDAEGNVVSKKEFATFRQEFVAPASLRPGDSVKLIDPSAKYEANGATTSLELGKDYNVIGYSASGDVTAGLVFAGYALKNDEKEYDTFFDGAKIDGKIAIVMRFEPMNAEGKSLWVEEGGEVGGRARSGAGWTNSAALDAKLRAAERAGATGIILVSAPGANDERVSRLEDLSLMPPGQRGSRVPVVMMSLDAADALVKAADEQGRGLLELRQAADNLAKNTAGLIELPKAQVTLNVKLERIPLLTDNVGAILPGKGNLAEEYIVIGSHYDHVGYGYFGSRDPAPRGKLHAGADDNGSGTSGNLLVAQKFAKAYGELPEGSNARSILFLWFSAEESGLNGSRFYVNNPIVDLKKHRLMINMDMIGRLRDGKLEIGGVGTAKGMKDWLQPYITPMGWTVKQSSSGYGPSDHASFTAKEIPTLFFFTQLHAEYHTPQDVVSTINYEGATQVADLAYRIALDAAMKPDWFEFDNGDAKTDSAAAEPKDGAAAATPATPAPGAGPGGTGVRFGIAPGDYAGDEEGVMIGEVFPDLPAAKAGLKEGDLMTKWNETELKSVETWMPMLRDAKAGDVVKITYKRKVDGAYKEFTTEATLISRARRQQQ